MISNEFNLDEQTPEAAPELQGYVERWERLESEKKEIAEAQKELMAEAKGRGYDTKVLREVVRRRKRDPNELAEFEATLEMYLAALGL